MYIACQWRQPGVGFFQAVKDLPSGRDGGRTACVLVQPGQYER